MTKNSIPHTPLPWKKSARRGVLDPYSEEVLVSGFSLPGGNHPKAGESEANTDLILSAVNAFAAFVELARLITRDYSDAADWKDIRPRLYGLAIGALYEAGVSRFDDDELAALTGDTND